MKRRRVIVAVLLAVLVATAPTEAALIPDPVSSYLLKVIAQVLAVIQEVELTIQRINQERIDFLVSLHGFPKSVTRDIGQTITAIRGIRDELVALSCEWRFTPRTVRLRDMYLRPIKLCKADFQRAWGTPKDHWDADLQEIHDYAGALTANMIADRAQAEQTWERAFPSLEVQSAALRKTPGEANRDEAVALAGAGVVADSNSALATQSLLLAQLERDRERFEDRKHHDMAAFLLLSAAGGDPFRGTPATRRQP